MGGAGSPRRRNSFETTMKPFSVLRENISTPTRDINSAIQRRVARVRGFALENADFEIF
jgi:hypothetical protein